MPGERLTKLDVVQRQLRTAIRLFFEEADTVSTYTLAAAVEGVLSGLLKRRGVRHPVREAEFIRKAKGKEFNDVLNLSQNFFKHAGRDPDAVHEFPDLATEYELILCVSLYHLYRGRHLREGFLFAVWFSLHYPDLVEGEAVKAHLDAMKAQAPKLATERSTYLELVERPDLYPTPHLD